MNSSGYANTPLDNVANQTKIALIIKDIVKLGKTVHNHTLG